MAQRLVGASTQRSEPSAAAGHRRSIDRSSDMQALLRSRTAARALSLGLALLLASAPTLADTPAAGYQLGSIPSPSPFAATCTLPGGDIVTFDGLSVDRWTAAGAPRR